MPNTKKNLATLSIDELVPILDSISDAIFIDDAQGYTIWVNKASEELYKIKRADIIGKHVSYLERSGIFTPSVALLVMEQKKEVNIIHENKDGKRLLTTGIPIMDKEGNMTKIITTSNDITELINLQNALEDAQNTIHGLKTQENLFYDNVVFTSRSMYNVIQLTKRLANVDSTVLITGESGVGKGVIAKLLHENGNRKAHPFVTVNCGAIPENLIESELFGYERGAFTGSKNEGKKGLFEVAQKGTIFLDEISELPLKMQVKLLQVIQEKEITKIGGITNIPVDVRIVSATNKDLISLVQSGQFREDLYYRLNVVPISVPPLRERLEDIIPLIKMTLNKQNKKFKEHKELDSAALAILMKYSWPGNIRELQNLIERLVITTKGNVILPENLPSFILEETRQYQEKDITVHKISNLKELLDTAEKEILVKSLEQCKSTRAMAKMLGISQPTVVRKLQKHKVLIGDTK
ncbi:sigma-54 interaction domain-containing protein [Anaerovorax odorimutans]|uniref:sigma-54 interaction domain-containing protein n=1 Tax=Anaerovorax odorimutans TaxID=109327 RepID=UPI000427B58D|nr:sigma 54-interacting transcriptional regulator [Anaerovorax odorimutans]